jgi:hypothetical protein
VVLGGLLLVVALPQATRATDIPVRLALTPVGQAGPYFDLVMKPGESRGLKVDVLNAGVAALVVRSYAADVYTIVNGGFGGRERGDAQTGMTRWVSYPTDVRTLSPGVSVRRSFTVAVPAGTRPGEYITSLVLENDQPVAGDGAVALDQIVRQAVAVVVTVPGSRSPGLTVGAASYLAGAVSVVSVAVTNTGNIRLKPIVGFTLLDARGAQVAKATVAMDTFYALTATTIEVPLPAPLAPGDYTVHLTLADAAQGARADRAGIPFTVAAPPPTAPPAAAGFDLTETIQAVGEGRLTPLAWLLLLGCVLLVALAGALVFNVRRRGRTATSDR